MPPNARPVLTRHDPLTPAPQPQVAPPPLRSPLTPHSARSALSPLSPLSPHLQHLPHLTARRPPGRRKVAHLAAGRPFATAAALWIGLPSITAAHAAVPAVDTNPLSSELRPMTLPAATENATTASRHTAWWMAFDDASLNLLVQRAAERERGLSALAGTGDDTQDVERQVVAAYLGVRVLSARWLTLNGVRDAAERQRQWLSSAAGAATGTGNAGPSAAATLTDGAAQATLARLQARLRTVEQLQAGLAGERDRLLARLAGHCGLEPADLADLLTPVLTKPVVPVFASAVPAKLPRSILRARADVAQAEAAALRSARLSGQQQAQVVEGLREAQGWIEPVAGPSMMKVSNGAPTLAAAVATLEAPATPELAALRRLMAVASQEVAQDLRSLNERAADLAAESQRADTTRLAYLAARDRLKTGEVSEWQVLEQYQQLLAASDRQAAASGELALAWLKLVASTGASEQVLVR